MIQVNFLIFAKCYTKKGFAKAKPEKLERAMGFGPTTSTLARLRSTPELYPQEVEQGNIYHKKK